MSSHPSKSTKRRRFLEDLEVSNVYIENPNQNSVNFDNILETQNTTSELILPDNSVINNISDSIEPSSPLIDESKKVTYVSCNTSSTLETVEDEFILNVSSTDSDDGDETILAEYFTDDRDPILTMLCHWAVSYNITNVALSDLLKTLKKHKCFNFFPEDARTILKTNKHIDTKQVQVITPGIYYHFGTEIGLKSLGDWFQFHDETIKIVVGIDGLPLTKSSQSSFWPILGYVRNFPGKPKIFLIGLYWGKEKAKDSNLFLKAMIDEFKDLYKIGFKTPHGTKKVVIELFCCDAPAKSYILKTKRHGGFFSCTRCNVEGIYLDNRVCFPDREFIKKTHLDFINRTHEEYHVTESVSILTELPEVDMVYSFSLDYMHLTCLGVVKKLIMLWLGNIKGSPISVRLQNRKVQEISGNLLFLKSSMTSDFSRFPRGLNEVPRWKATEFRLFLLYIGPIVLKDILNNECYLHFMCLHICFRILLVKNSSDELVGFVEKLLSYFVQKFGIIYGQKFMSHNVHGLLHIVDDYKKFGPLDESSCFPFENYMKSLKKMVRKHQKPLEQVIKRYQEFLEFSNKPPISNLLPYSIEYKKPHNNGPILGNVTSQFQIVIVNYDVKIKTNSITDCYIGFSKEGILHIYKVLNICCNHITGLYFFIAKLFNNIEPFYDKPINSLKLGVAYVSNLSENIVPITISHLFQKYIVFNFHNNKQIALPILHSLNN
ncbi:uncharacterized protein LOC132946776 [Metopolophium dirhodum]|uniref:uncharacterized protein LOC132946776 n=1 Tax=Metopolophium dirhodum TaxID=44670 RepID=UPI00298FFF18|nr:uncharacterized protein LOC132946776 [Metopolophium dirhodum]